MPEFKIIEVKECKPGLWLDTWATKYDESAGFDEVEYLDLIALAQQVTLPAKYFERIGRWKDSAKTDGRWKPNVASVAYIIWLQAERERPSCPSRGNVVAFLEEWSTRSYEDVYSRKRIKKHFGLSRATTLLHFLSAGRFPIYDSRVIEAMTRLHKTCPSYTAGYYWDVFYPQFVELAAICGTQDFRRLDKALFSYGATRLLD